MMNSDPLEQTLAAYARQLPPSAPKRLTTDVWREIEKRRQKAFWSGFLPMLDWRELFSEPRLAVAALMLATAMGVVPATIIARAENQKSLARESIHFEVFSVNSTAQLAVIVPSLSASRVRR